MVGRGEYLLFSLVLESVCQHASATETVPGTISLDPAPSVLVFPSEWLFGTTFSCNQPRHQSATMEEARGAAACQPGRPRARLVDVAWKGEEQEKMTGTKSRHEGWADRAPVESAPDRKGLN